MGALSDDGSQQRGWDQNPKPEFRVGCLTSLTTSPAKLHLPSSLLKLSARQTPATFLSHPIHSDYKMLGHTLHCAYPWALDPRRTPFADY